MIHKYSHENCWLCSKKQLPVQITKISGKVYLLSAPVMQMISLYL